MFALPFILSVSGCIVFIIVVSVLMRPRRFYLVRHGETFMNAAHIRQGADGALSEKGVMQAHTVGKALAEIRIGRIVSSTYERARQTAGIIASYVQAPIVYSPLFAERRNPSSIIGRSAFEPDVVKIVDQMDMAYHDDNFRIADEENFIDLVVRARKCLRYLAFPGPRAVVVVTHHHFLKILLAYMLFRNQLHANDFVRLSFYNNSDNAGVTVVEYNPWRFFSPTRGWSVLGFNEHAQVEETTPPQ